MFFLPPHATDTTITSNTMTTRGHRGTAHDDGGQDDRIYTVGLAKSGDDCVLGPMVLCCFVVDPDTKDALATMGFRGVIQYASAGRQMMSGLRDRLELMAAHFTNVVVGARMINESCTDGFDRLVAQAFSLAVREIPEHIRRYNIVVDTYESSANVVAYLEQNLPGTRLNRVVAEPLAEMKHAVVAAASIVAKETREDYMEAIRKSSKGPIGDRARARVSNRKCGSGFKHDHRTLLFMKRFHKSHGRHLHERLCSPDYTGPKPCDASLMHMIVTPISKHHHRRRHAAPRHRADVRTRVLYIPTTPDP